MTANLFTHLGFPVVATSSRAIAAALGYDDHQGAPPAEMLAAAARVARSVTVPVTADLEGGYGLGAAELVDILIERGIVGLNLEDTDYATGSGLVPASEHASYLHAIKQAAQQRGVDLVLNARVDVYLQVQADPSEQLIEIEQRAKRYVDAGADCVFPIGIRSEAAIERLVDSVGMPINVMAYPKAPTPRRLAELGVARISLAGGLTTVACDALTEATKDLLTLVDT